MDLGELDIELLLYLQMQGWCRCRIWPDIDLYPRLGLDPPITLMTTDYGFRTVTVSRSLNGISRRRDGRDWIDGYTTYAFPFTLKG